MENSSIKHSLSDFSDRELLELLLANQLHIFRRIKVLEYKAGTDGGEVDEDFSDTFRTLSGDAKEILAQINKQLADK